MSRALAENRPQLYHSLYPPDGDDDVADDDDDDVMLRMMGMSKALAANRPKLYHSLYPSKVLSEKRSSKRTFKSSQRSA